MLDRIRDELSDAKQALPDIHKAEEDHKLTLPDISKLTSVEELDGEIIFHKNKRPSIFIIHGE